MSIPFYKKIISYFFPVIIESIHSPKNNLLKLKLYQNQFMLTNPEAIYSFGTNYSPFSRTLKKIKPNLPTIQTFLLLGTGLGSALKILQKKYACFPISTLVDIDENVIEYSKKYMQLNSMENVTWICDDAFEFVQKCNTTYDLIGIDVFNGIAVPYDLQTNYFVNSCKKIVSKNGILIINYISQNKYDALFFESNLKANFEDIEQLKEDNNIFFICKNV